MTAQAAAALCVGGMVVARALLDRALADELRDSYMTVALQLGGWGTLKKEVKENEGRNENATFVIGRGYDIRQPSVAAYGGSNFFAVLRLNLAGSTIV